MYGVVFKIGGSVKYEEREKIKQEQSSIEIDYSLRKNK